MMEWFFGVEARSRTAFRGREAAALCAVLELTSAPKVGCPCDRRRAFASQKIPLIPANAGTQITWRESGQQPP
jgi:hypothetical protein